MNQSTKCIHMFTWGIRNSGQELQVQTQTLPNPSPRSESLFSSNMICSFHSWPYNSRQKYTVHERTCGWVGRSDSAGPCQLRRWRTLPATCRYPKRPVQGLRARKPREQWATQVKFHGHVQFNHKHSNRILASTSAKVPWFGTTGCGWTAMTVHSHSVGTNKTSHKTI